MLGTTMFGREKVVCRFCQRDTREDRSHHAADRPDVIVCIWCYTKWAAAGAECARCHTPVAGAEKVGVFTESHSFGHTDCGALHVRRSRRSVNVWTR